MLDRVRDGAIKVLIAAHSHPQLSKGGAEIAAFELYGALGRRPEYQPWFLGCVRDEMNQKLGATINQPFSEREYLYAGAAFDWFKFSNADPNFPREFRKLLQALQPRIVHFHHYLNFGVEAFLHVRQTLPECRIVLTMHEYLAVCHHYGQMVTRQNSTLCYEASPMRCTRCFKEITPSRFKPVPGHDALRSETRNQRGRRRAVAHVKAYGSRQTQAPTTPQPMRTIP